MTSKVNHHNLKSIQGIHQASLKHADALVLTKPMNQSNGSYSVLLLDLCAEHPGEVSELLDVLLERSQPVLCFDEFPFDKDFVSEGDLAQVPVL